MPIQVTCPQCAKSYTLSDSLANRSFKCAACGAEMTTPPGPNMEPPLPKVGAHATGLGREPGAPSAGPVAAERAAEGHHSTALDEEPFRSHSPEEEPRPSDAAIDAHRDLPEPFRRERFLLRQKLITLGERYTVLDDSGEPVIYVHRSAKILRNLGANFASLAVFFGVVALGAVILGGGEVARGLDRLHVGEGAAFFVAGIILSTLVGFWLRPRRHISISADAKETQPLLEITQDNKLYLPNAWFTLKSADGTELARFRKNFLYNILRKRWVAYRPDGREWFLAKEDSILKSILRRFLGPLFGALRTNFIYLSPDEAHQLGAFNRNWTILDRYVLDLTTDPEGRIDRRVALAMGVLLDTGEKR